ncbi:MAG: PAS domain-containing protein [candidate division Zixibacteria bacterium]|nr:PAS domain-containing protein [candidate division Zixibacteria bacterium]
MAKKRQSTELSDKPRLTNEEVSAILNSIADGVFTVDKDWRITSFNKAAEKITGVPENEAVGEYCCDVFRASICETECALHSTMETGKPVINKAIYIVNSDGEKVPISISTALLKDKDGNIIGGVETFRDLSMVEQLRKELHGKFVFEDIVSKNERMNRIFEILPLIAESDSPVLIEGESGTGKELIATAIHNLSQRRDGTFLRVNCGALPDNLLESELFGYKAGAFTDARKDKPGRFELAGKGTILLDEIGDISPALQVKLLRVLQDGTFEPLGGIKTLKSEARIIASTNRRLSEMVNEGKFRQDLYYRINVVKLEVPPLRERREDIPLLVEHFIGKFNRLKGKDISGIAADVARILINYDYPGNIRELENIIEHAFVLLSGGVISKEYLPDDILHRKSEVTTGAFSNVDDFQKRMILDALRRNNWNRTATAKDLGMHKTTLYRKIRNLGIELPARDGR